MPGLTFEIHKISVRFKDESNRVKISSCFTIDCYGFETKTKVFLSFVMISFKQSETDIL